MGDAQLASVMRADEDSEDPKKPKPVANRKKKTPSRYELLEAEDRRALRADDLDRHRHV